MLGLFDALEPDKPRSAAPAQPRKAQGGARAVGGGVAPLGGDPSPVMVSPSPAGDRARCGPMKIGDDCVYWSLYSGHFLAKITAVRSVLGQVDVDVFSDSGRRLLHRSKVPFLSQDKAHPESVYIGERPRQ